MMRDGRVGRRVVRLPGRLVDVGVRFRLRRRPWPVGLGLLRRIRMVRGRRLRRMARLHLRLLRLLVGRRMLRLLHRLASPSPRRVEPAQPCSAPGGVAAGASAGGRCASIFDASGAPFGSLGVSVAMLRRRVARVRGLRPGRDRGLHLARGRDDRPVCGPGGDGMRRRARGLDAGRFDPVGPKRARWSSRKGGVADDASRDRKARHGPRLVEDRRALLRRHAHRRHVSTDEPVGRHEDVLRLANDDRPSGIAGSAEDDGRRQRAPSRRSCCCRSTSPRPAPTRFRAPRTSRIPAIETQVP